MSIDNECQLFRVIPCDLKAKIKRSVYNQESQNYLLLLNLTAEYMSINIDYQLFREISIDLKNKI